MVDENEAHIEDGETDTQEVINLTTMEMLQSTTVSNFEYDDDNFITRDNMDQESTPLKSAVLEPVIVEEEAVNKVLRDARIFESLNLPGTSKQQEMGNITIPSPFKKNLFWPEPQDNKKKFREKVPSVATSAQWLTYHKKKKEEKERKEHVKMERAFKRKIKKEAHESKPALLSKKTKKVDYFCLVCDASWNKEKSDCVTSTWIDCDQCKRSVHM